MPMRRELLTSVALLAALSSCVAPVTSTAPAGAPAATASPSTPVPASVKPEPAPALPAAPPLAKDARLRLTGVVLFNDTPVADASLTAVDVATGKVIALTPWSDAPKGLKLLSTQRTDAKGAFDLALGHPWPSQDQSPLSAIPGQVPELPKLADNQLVKIVATKGNQTFTALFNRRGQAIGADTPTTASYQLQQGTAVSVTIRLRLTAGSTAATQSFEGVLKLTFQLPEGASAERQAAVLEAARKAAQEVEAALAKKSPLSAIPGLRGVSPSPDKSPLSAIPGLRGVSPSPDKSPLSARLVAAVNSEGAVSQVENFRTAVTNLGVFQNLFKAVQAELLALAAQKLEVRKDLSPIDASEFPLDQIVISPSGFLGFSGQRAPINLGGVVNTNFFPTPPRGGGGAAVLSASVVTADSAFSWGGLDTATGLGIYGDIDGFPDLSNSILVTDYSEEGGLYRLSATGNSVASFTLTGMTRLSGVAPAGPGTTTIVVSADHAPRVRPSVARYAWDNSLATYTLEASGAVGLYAAGGVVAGGRYWQFSGSESPGEDFIRSWPLTGALGDAASNTLMIDDVVVGRRPLDINLDVPTLFAYGASSLAVQANGTATRVYWVTQDGHLIRYADEGGVATATVIATPSVLDTGVRYGGVALAPGGNRLYGARHGKAYYIDNPAATGTTPTLVYLGPIPAGFVYGGAQTRSGSVVFAIGGNTASSVVRIPTPQ